MKKHFNIKRFKDVLTNDGITLILNDILSGQKKECWMWYGFPQQIPPQVMNVATDKSIYFNMNENEAVLFLKDERLFKYYKCALGYLYSVLLDISTYESFERSLIYFFGYIDFLKFRCHIVLFNKALKSLLTKTKYRTFYNDIFKKFLYDNFIIWENECST